ncbi:MAG: hypothetical protein J0L88_00520 [Xanthomonadales bacterium]|nr:hypothetical protein [Xanthomonadales bacterium]
MNRLPLLPLAVATLACASVASAQETRVPREGGDLIVRSSGETGYKPSGPAPAFTELDGDRNGVISLDEANGYALLANDFIKADANRDGRVSKREYERWAAQP